MPSPYVVTLVNPDVLRGSPGDRSGGASATVQDVSRSLAATTLAMEMKKDAGKQFEKKEDILRMIEKKRNIEKVVKLRSMISLKASGRGEDTGRAEAPPSAKGDMFDDYYRQITQEIWQQWVYPDTGRKDIEAIISIRILKDGTAVIQNIEKSSGNPLFDKAALKALARASPLAPPPYEMEIGVRFYP